MKYLGGDVIELNPVSLHFKSCYKRWPIRRFPNCSEDAAGQTQKGRQHNTTQTHPHSTGHQGETDTHFVPRISE